MTTSSSNSKQWRFFRAGGFDQVKLETGTDLLALDQLDLKLWVALACPTSGVDFDKATLTLMDTDKDGRVRAPELMSAVKWAGSLLRNPDDLLKGSPTLPLSAINDSIAEGKGIVTFARKVLGKPESGEVSVDEAAAASKALASHRFNGDGILPADSAEDEAIKQVIQAIISCLGADMDASGKPGVGQPKVDQFFNDAAAYSDWWKKAEADAAILPLGLATPTAATAVQALRGKIEDYFARCQLAAFDPRAAGPLNRDEKDYLALAAKDLTRSSAEISMLPLARIEANAPLPLGKGINPAWAPAVASLREQAVKPLLGERDSLTENDWAALLAKLAPYYEWAGTRAGASVEKLGLETIREILSSDARQILSALIAEDKDEEGSARAILGLNRLVRYHRDLAQLCYNFVSFRDFYGRKRKAIFQAGTLYLDQRSCDLCLRVEDPAKHALMAGMAGTYLAYCDCIRKGTNEKMQIVAAFTAGDSDNLMAGRNGIFFDPQGRDWDATVTKIIDNPISIRQAFFAPYKKLVRFVEEQVAKRAAAAEAEKDAKLATAAKAAGTVPPARPTPPATGAEPAKPKVDTGTLAAIGLVLTTLLAALAGIFGAIAGLPFWQIPLAIIAIIVVISTPSMILAYLKLRRRNLAPILDANGWAVNARAKINVPFGGALTRVAMLPPGSQRDLLDPFAEKKAIWPKLLLALLLAGAAIFLLNRFGYIYEWTNGKIGTRPSEPPAAASGPAEEKPPAKP